MTTPPTPGTQPPVKPGEPGSPEAQTPPGTGKPQGQPHGEDKDKRINDLMSNWQTEQKAHDDTKVTVASLEDENAELRTQMENPSTGDSERAGIEAAVKNKELEKENLKLHLEKTLEKCPNAKKGVEKGTLNLDHVTSVEALLNLERTLEAIVTSVKPETPEVPPVTPPATPPSGEQPQGQPGQEPPKGGEQPTPTPEKPQQPAPEPQPPEAGSMAGGTQEPTPEKQTLAKEKQEALQEMVNTGDPSKAVELYFPETKGPQGQA